MRKALLLLAAFACSAISMAQTVSPQKFQEGKIWFKIKNDEIPGKIKVGNYADVPLSTLPFLDKVSAQAGIKKLSMPFIASKTTAALQRTYLLQLNNDEQVDVTIKMLQQCKEVEYAERVPLHRTAAAPNDSYYAAQWHLNTIKADSAWNYFSTGSNIVIAIVDDAVETSHPDLAPNLWVNAGEIAGNGIDDDNNGYIDDVNGYDAGDDDGDPSPSDPSFDHGTGVAGMASAATNNSIGIAGIGYSCKLMCVKSGATLGDPGNIYGAFEGVYYAASAGADIINMSWGSDQYSVTEQNIINYAVSQGCILVAGAGNDDTDVRFYPAAYDSVIAVGSTTSSDERSSFSNYGSWVSVCAPGSAVYTTQVNSTYDNEWGTSFSSPLVAGLLGLMKSMVPAMPNDALVNCMLNSADNIDAMNPWYVGSLGTGRINALSAMKCVNTALTLQPIAGFKANQTSLTAGGNVTFTDTSANIPWTWVWSFPGGTPSTYTGQTPPPIFYSAPGTYDVSLTVSNGNGNNTKTTNSYITVGNPLPCRSVNYPLPAGWSGANYNEGANNGYTNGTNVYGDKEKAMYYDMSATPASYLTKTNIAFTKAYSSNTEKTVAIKIYDGTSGVPGALLGYEDVTMAAIIPKAQTGNYTQVEFDPAVALPASGKFFVSVDISNLCWTCTPRDTLAIASNMNGQTVPSAIWERQSNNIWYMYGSPGTSAINASLIMHPYITNQPALATFTETATTVCAGQSITFDATGSTGQDSLIWNLQGAIDPVVNGSVLTTAVYTIPGIYVAELRVKGGGCHQSRRDTVVVAVNFLPVPVVLQQGNLLSVQTYSGYQWLLNGAVINNGTSSTLAAQVDGSYSVIVTDAAGCSDTSAPVQVTVSGLYNIDNSSVTVYPNPTSGIVLVNLNSLEVVTDDINVFNTIGQMVKSVPLADMQRANACTVDLSALPNGVYTVKVQSALTSRAVSVILAR
ncbi:MAG TPA: S8 family serine peptidase [Chitinophagales bacterium]|nr:S8 family serine peptidase [Chitinophagales bacterium]